jgi:hypothetical protein
MSVTQRIAKLKSLIAGDSWPEPYRPPQPEWPGFDPTPPEWPGFDRTPRPEWSKHYDERIDKTLHGKSCEICNKHAQAVGQLADLFKLHGGSSEALRGHVDAARTLLNSAHDMHIDDAHGGDNSKRASVESFAPQYSTSSRIASLRKQIRK